MRRHRLAALGLLGALLAAPWIALAALPHAGSCVVQRILHIPCPGCGLGRALAALARADLVACVLSYPPMPFLAGAYALLLLVAAAALAGRRAEALRRAAGLMGLALAVSVLANWAVQLGMHFVGVSTMAG
ncbi:MAG: DUF2752 domain-containing protein [Deltaproteobacteria bacterium]|nr:DUF2752 domain-containing protein [Deltaproteobacteria bacterium]